jgi:D-3-phosphoglycerate dehydrogenase
MPARRQVGGGALSEAVKKRVVLTDLNVPGGVDFAREACEAAGFDFVFADTRDERELAAAVRDADGILVQFAPLTRAVIEATDGCRAISRYGIGLDNVDLDAAAERAIEVFRLPDYCLNEVADHAVALLLTINRKVLQFDRCVRNGTWNEIPGDNVKALQSCTLGIVGLGNIGRLVATQALSLGMRVVAYDAYAVEEAVPGVERVDELDQLLGASDYVSLHCPLTEGTFHLIDGERLKAFRKGAVLINTSRGGLVDTEALIAALNDATLEAAALDVFEEEPLPNDHPLLQMDNVVLTPHVAWSSYDALDRLRKRPVAQLIEFLTGTRSVRAWGENPPEADGAMGGADHDEGKRPSTRR